MYNAQQITTRRSKVIALYNRKYLYTYKNVIPLEFQMISFIQNIFKGDDITSNTVFIYIYNDIRN